ncbi:MAG: N-acetyltransferase [Nocardioidaceae bacterium]|nr:N-acetyltransferase [Nocardioidaceae bacterium]
MSEVTVRDNTEAHHWEAVVDNEVAGFAQYELDGDTITFVHTEVDPAYGGQGIGTALITASLDDARRRGRTVVPLCPFYAHFFKEREEYADLLG